jgi:hypothetical protein
MKFVAAPDQVYFSFYVFVFKWQKEPFNVLILGSLPSRGFFVSHRVFSSN